MALRPRWAAPNAILPLLPVWLLSAHLAHLAIMGHSRMLVILINWGETMAMVARVRRAWERKGDSDDFRPPPPHPHVSLAVHAITHACPWPSSPSMVLLSTV